MVKREKGPAPLPPPLAAAAHEKEISVATKEQIVIPIIEEALKIVEHGDEETPESNRLQQTKEIIPPPPPEFASDSNSDEPKSRNTSKNSIESTDDGEVKLLLKENDGRPASHTKIHQEVERSVSIEEKSSSPTSSPTILANHKLNTSTITINQLHDKSNSLASNINQVTVVTSHPPVIIDNTQATPDKKKLSKSVSCDTNTSLGSNEVVIVSNETNKSQHVHDSDDDYQSYDSLESSPKYKNNNLSTIVDSNKSKPRKLDESEVLIVSPEGIFEEDLEEVSTQTDGDTVKSKLLDTSHVSVVTVGDEQVKVKDSSHVLVDSNSDLSHSESSDGIDFVTPVPKINGQMIYNSKRSTSSREDDVSIIVQSGSIATGKAIKRLSPDSSVDCSSSMDSPTRTQSESGSVKSSNYDNSKTNNIISSAVATTAHKNQDRSDAESISTNASHDSREPDDMEGVQLRKKEPEDILIIPPPSPKRPARTKEEIQIANLKKKTRKRTRKFEIDGVQMTTTTSKVIYGDDENGRMYDDHIFRKQELRELKLLQKQEKKQFYDLQAKEQIAKDQQDKKFEQERLALERTYEADMDVLARQHKQTVEKYEQQQENELRNTSKKIRLEQERELKLVSSIRRFSFIHARKPIYKFNYFFLVPRCFETRNPFVETRNRFITERQTQGRIQKTQDEYGG